MKDGFKSRARFAGARLTLLLTAMSISFVASAFPKSEGDPGKVPTEVQKKARYSLVKIWDEKAENIVLSVWDAEAEEVLPLDGGEDARVSDFMIDEPKNKARFVIDGKNVVLKNPFNLEEKPKREKREPIGKRLAERRKTAARKAELSPESLGALLEGTEFISRSEGGRKDKKNRDKKEAQK